MIILIDFPKDDLAIGESVTSVVIDESIARSLIEDDHGNYDRANEVGVLSS